MVACTTSKVLIVTGFDSAACVLAMLLAMYLRVGYIPMASTPLAPNTTYTLTLTSAITDTAGNPLQGAPVTSSFTTAP